MIGSLVRYALPPLMMIALVVAVFFLGDRHGAYQANATWQAAWDSEQSRLSEAKAVAEAEQRNIEQARQRAANEAAQNGQEKIDAANRARASSIAAAVGLRREADAIVDRLTASQSSLSACTIASSKAAASAARVLADVLGRADQRAGSLASVADQARARGLTCEASYDGLDSK